MSACDLETPVHSAMQTQHSAAPLERRAVFMRELRPQELKEGQPDDTEGDKRCTLPGLGSRPGLCLENVRSEQLHLGQKEVREYTRLKHVWCLHLNQACFSRWTFRLGAAGPSNAPRQRNPGRARLGADDGGEPNGGARGDLPGPLPKIRAAAGRLNLRLVPPPQAANIA